MAVLEIPSKGRTVEILLDQADLDALGHFNWRLVSSGRYAGRAVAHEGKPSTELLHRRICGLSFGDPRIVHHRNENTFDNRRSNLEVMSHGEHQRLWKDRGYRTGRSPFRGVHFNSATGKWRVKVIYRGIVWTGATHDTPEAASVEAKAIRRRLEAGEKPPMTLRRAALLRHHAEKRAA